MNGNQLKPASKQWSRHVFHAFLVLVLLSSWSLVWGPGCGTPDNQEKTQEKSKEEKAKEEKPVDNNTTDQVADAGDEPGKEPSVTPDKKVHPDKSVTPDDPIQKDDDKPKDAKPNPDQPPVGTCTAPPAPPAGKLCTVSGSGKSTLIVATLLLPGKVLKNGQLLIDDQGKIACVGCGCRAKAPADARKLECPDGVVSPGLINAHDHLGWALGKPAGHGSERYEHRHDWRKGKRGHTKISSGGSNNSREATAWAEIRMMMSGATSIVGSGGTDGLIRNLDRNREGIPGRMKYDTFPLGDSGGTLSKSGCSSYKIRKPADLGSYDSYVPHVSEGIDLEAQNEFACISTSQGGGQLLTLPKTAIIHGVGLTPRDIALMAKSGTALIWSPRTNIDLYGNTASLPLFLKYGVPIALGTDWPLSGSMNMSRELQCVDSLNRNNFNNILKDADIVAMATSWAAKATKTDKFIGSLKVGLLADIALFDGSKNKSYRAVIDAKPQDVYLVMRQGKPLYGSASIIEGLVSTGSTDCDQFDVCSASKRICIKGELTSQNVKTFAELQTHLSSKNPYPLFFCGQPKDEPSCLPTRPGEYGQSKPNDKDGDGIEDSKDNCPDVFNPIRPMDNKIQADADKDGKGDVCDPCPLTPNSTKCTAFDPNDKDGDKVPNATDNCPNIANPKQEDRDKDKIGDVCDPCPDADNSGGKGCPASIYDIKQKKVAMGSVVLVSKALIVAHDAQRKRLIVQIVKGDTGYKTAEYSALFIYAGNLKPIPAYKVGDRVTVQGKVQEYNGQIQLSSLTTFTVTPGTETPPAAVVVKVADINSKTAPKAAAYDSLLVEVKNVEVTNRNPDDPKDYGEFQIAETSDKTKTVRVDDIFDTSSYIGSSKCTWDPATSTGKDTECYSRYKCQCPLASCTAAGDGRCYAAGGTVRADQRKVGDTFKTVRGFLIFSFGFYKLAPTQDSDLVK